MVFSHYLNSDIHESFLFCLSFLSYKGWWVFCLSGRVIFNHCHNKVFFSLCLFGAGQQPDFERTAKENFWIKFCGELQPFYSKPSCVTLAFISLLAHPAANVSWASLSSGKNSLCAEGLHRVMEIVTALFSKVFPSIF